MSAWPIPLTPLTAESDVRTLLAPNLSSSSRNLALVAFCFMRAAFLSFLVAFPERMPSALRSVPGVYPGSCLDSFDMLGATLPPRLDFFTVDTFAYSCVTSEHPYYSPRFGSHVFRGGGAPRHGCRGKLFRFVGMHQPPVLSTCPLHTNSGFGKERRILISPW